MKKNIVVFHLLNNFTGSPQVLRTVLDSLDREEYEIEIFTSQTNGFLSDIQGVSYHSNFYFRSRFRIITLLTFFFSQILLFIRLLLLRRETNNTVYFINTVLPFSAILVGKLKGLKVVCHIHEFRISPKLLNTFLFLIVNRFADVIIIVSHYLKSNHLKSKAVVHVVYNTVKSGFDESIKVKESFGVPFTVLMLASLRPYKGITEFVKLAEKLSDVRFNLVLSESSSSIDHYFRSIKTSANLNIYPIQQSVKFFYENSDLVVNLSDSKEWIETFGLTALEAMFYGLPVIVPTVGGISELVDHGGNGFRIDSKNEKELVEIIELLKNDISLWKRLSKRSSEKSKEFSPFVFKDSMNEIIGNVFTHNLK
jgi:glycosyltransferase involved in cell wall biosynthesis